MTVDVVIIKEGIKSLLMMLLLALSPTQKNKTHNPQTKIKKFFMEKKNIF